MILELPLELLAYVFGFCGTDASALSLAHACRGTWWLRREYLRALVLRSFRPQEHSTAVDHHSSMRAFGYLCVSGLLPTLSAGSLVVEKFRQLLRRNTYGFTVCVRKMTLPVLRRADRLFPELMTGPGRRLALLLANADPAVLGHFGPNIVRRSILPVGGLTLFQAIWSGEDHFAALKGIVPITPSMVRRCMSEFQMIPCDHWGASFQRALQWLNPAFNCIIGLLFNMDARSLAVAARHYDRIDRSDEIILYRVIKARARQRGRGGYIDSLRVAEAFGVADRFARLLRRANPMP